MNIRYRSLSPEEWLRFKLHQTEEEARTAGYTLKAHLHYLKVTQAAYALMEIWNGGAGHETITPRLREAIDRVVAEVAVPPSRWTSEPSD